MATYPVSIRLSNGNVIAIGSPEEARFHLSMASAARGVREQIARLSSEIRAAPNDRSRMSSLRSTISRLKRDLERLDEQAAAVDEKIQSLDQGKQSRQGSQSIFSSAGL